MKLAIFDLDNTLINGDSDHAWVEYLIKKGIIHLKYRKINDQFLKDYTYGNLKIMDYFYFSLRILSKFSLIKLNNLHDQYMKEIIEPIILPKAELLIENHKSKGKYILIITATNKFITQPIANRLKVDDIIATDIEIKEKKYTGNFIGVPSFKHGKIIKLKQWLKNNKFDIKGASFYSDSINDLPLLKFVDYPITVDPDYKLRNIAKIKNWPIISLRN
ncbi:Phosphoserine phosphatase [Candidatus Johnevansia muelleri]|uniref:Phosphoserine phosphatase n=1 Tax=Candidatus Johnevansia muelleri TaxID=1495769 RepID=A0A078KE33_9GAMM|nr:Phosphoserine phosphatase [Candidatus Evansia muelleri]